MGTGPALCDDFEGRRTRINVPHNPDDITALLKFARS
jgi:hypothetical protein